MISVWIAGGSFENSSTERQTSPSPEIIFVFSYTSLAISRSRR